MFIQLIYSKENVQETMYEFKLSLTSNIMDWCTGNSPGKHDSNPPNIWVSCRRSPKPVPRSWVFDDSKLDLLRFKIMMAYGNIKIK